tara:strand:- start:126 stop:554 length:429 start_codon:yes stop_codon:yes gene_type:complete
MELLMHGNGFAQASDYRLALLQNSECPPGQRSVADGATEHQSEKGAIFHTDRGSEFADKELKAVLDEHNLLNSKSRKGCCWDNENMESLYHTLKTEMVYFHQFDRLVEALAHIMDHMHFYNHDRLHSSLDYQSSINNQLQAA